MEDYFLGNLTEISCKIPLLSFFGQFNDRGTALFVTLRHSLTLLCKLLSFWEVGVRQVFKGGNYSKEEIIVFLILSAYHTNKLISVVSDYCKYCKNKTQIGYWSILSSFKLLFSSFEHFITANKSQKSFLLRKLFKGGNYSKEETINY